MISLLECITLIERLVGRKTHVSFQDGRLGDLRYFVTDYSKFRRATGWEPRVLPEDGVARLVQWIASQAGLFEAVTTRPRFFVGHFLIPRAV